MFKQQINYSKNKEKYNSHSAEIEKLIPPMSRVLDIGCTTGKLARILRRKKCQTIGVDIDPIAVKIAAKYSEKVIRADLDDIGDLTRKLKSEKFDVIVFGDVLEHLKYPGTILFELKKYLKLNGLIVAQIPNSAFIWMRARFFLGNFAYSKKGGLMDEDHLRFFSFKTARVLFENSGYKIKKIYGASQVRTRYWFLRYLAKIAPTLFAIHILIIGER